MLCLLRIRHLSHLVCNILEPSLVGFRVCDHFRELSTNNRLLVQLLAEDHTLISPLHTFLRHRPHPPNRRINHHPSLMVKVRKNDVDSLVLHTQQILGWNLDVVECDKRCACGGGVRSLNCLGLNAFLAFDQHHGETLIGLNTGDKVVAPHAVRDPFLSSIDNVV